jgi:microcystin-dependent protein
MEKKTLQKLAYIFVILASIIITFRVLTWPNCKKRYEDYTNTTPPLTGPNNLVLTDDDGNLSSIQFPPGMIIAWKPKADADKTSAPAGWAICDGTNDTPDLRGRFILGSNPHNKKNTSFTPRETDEKGGSETHTLTISEIPAHDHSINQSTNNILLVDDGRTPLGALALVGWGSRTGTNGVSKWSNPKVDSVGAGAPHNNMPPFYTIIYIIKL